MLNTSTRASGAMLRPIQTDATTLSPRKAAKAIARLTHAEPRELSSLFGPNLRGLVPLLFDENGATPLSESLRLLTGPRGPTGFTIENDGVDYAAPENGPFLYQGSNLNLGIGLSTMTLEEALARHIASQDLPEALTIELAELGVVVSHLPLRIAHKIAYGIVSECIANALTASQMGALNVLRSHAPTIRASLIEALLASDAADAIRDLLLAAPILALAPSLLPAGAGRKPKELLRELGLPVEARRLQARALSPMRHWMLHDGRDLTEGDIGWLTPQLLNALPENSYLQYRVTSLALHLLLTGMNDADVAVRCTWAAQNAKELFNGKPAIADWMRASPRFLSQAVIREWHPQISVETAIEAAAATARAHELFNAATTQGGFRLPPWAFPRDLPRSKWHLHPIKNEFELVAAGRRFRNCCATYADACRDGTVIIAEIRRPATKDTRLPVVNGFEIGAMVEICHRWGRWALIQSRGFANGAPITSAAAAAQRLVNELNGEAR